MTDITKLSSTELLALYARIGGEFDRRGLTRTANGLVGDLAEHLFCKAFDWKRAESSRAHLDATDSRGNRYQIKGRRLTRRNRSREMSAIRNLEENRFDMLAGVLFREDYGILRAAIVPRSIVTDRATFVQRTNSHKFILGNNVWDMPGVRDVTEALQAVEL